MTNIVEFIVRGVNQSKQTFDEVKDDAKKSSEGLGSVGKAAAGMATAVVGGAVAAAGALYKVGSTFDEAYDTIRTGTGATGQALQGLENDFKAVVKDVPASFGEASAAITELSSRTNQTGPALQELTKQELELARITGTDLKTNIEATTRMFGDWGISAQDQAGSLDKLYRASQATGVGVDKLSQSVVQFGAPLRGMGFDFGQAVSLVGQFEKAGVNTELVMGSLRIALGKVASDQSNLGKSSLEAEKAQKALSDAIAKHGENSLQARTAQEALAAAQDKVKMSSGSAKDVFMEYVAKIKAAPSATAAAGIAIDLFGKKAGPDMADTIRGGKFEIGALFDKINGGKDTILGAASDTEDFAEKWEKFKNRTLVTLEPIAGRVFGAVGDAMDKMGPSLDNLVEKLGPVLQAAVSTLSGVLSAVMPLLSALVSVITALGPALIPISEIILAVVAALKAWSIIQAILNIELLANPIGLIIVAIGLLIGIIVVVVQHWETVKRVTGEVFSAIWSVITSVVGAIVDFVKDHWQLLLMIFLGPLGLILGFVISHWDQIKAVFSASLDFVISLAKDALDFLVSLFNRAVDLIVSLFLNWTLPGLIIKHWDTIKRVFSDGVNAVVDFMYSLPGRIGDAISSLGSMMFNAGKRVIQSMIDGIMSMVHAVGDAIGSVASKIRNALPFSPAKEGPLSGSGSPEIAGSQIPRMIASGMLGSIGDVTAAIYKIAASVNLPLGGVSGAFRTSTASSSFPALPGSFGSGQDSRTVIELHPDGTQLGAALLEIVAKAIRVRGGDVQLVLGG